MNLQRFGRIRVGRLDSALERRQGVVPRGLPVIVVVPVGRLVILTILFIEEFGGTVRAPIVVGVGVGAGTLRELRELKGRAGVSIKLSVDFYGSAKVKDESGD
jgi:hypothetical protein